MIASAGLHLWLSYRFYFHWAWTSPVIDGGPLGFLTWTIPTLVGSLAYDAVAQSHDDPNLIAKLAGWSVVLMMLGYALSCLGGYRATPPFLPPPASHVVDLWTMSQRTGSVSYLTFSAGVSLAVYALFVLICDHWGWQFSLFRIFGQNALAAYIIHPMVASAVKPYLPNDAPALVRRSRLWPLFRNLHALEPLPGKARALSAALSHKKRDSPVDLPHLVLQLEFAVFAHLLGLSNEFASRRFERFRKRTLGNLVQDGQPQRGTRQSLNQDLGELQADAG